MYFLGNLKEKLTIDWVKAVELAIALIIGFGAVYYGARLAQHHERENKALEKYAGYVLAAKQINEIAEPTGNKIDIVPSKFPSSYATSDPWYYNWLFEYRKSRNDFLSSHYILMSYVDNKDKRNQISEITANVIRRTNTVLSRLDCAYSRADGVETNDYCLKSAGKRIDSKYDLHTSMLKDTKAIYKILTEGDDSGIEIDEDARD